MEKPLLRKMREPLYDEQEIKLCRTNFFNDPKSQLSPPEGMHFNHFGVSVCGDKVDEKLFWHRGVLHFDSQSYHQTLPLAAFSVFPDDRQINLIDIDKFKQIFELGLPRFRDVRIPSCSGNLNPLILTSETPFSLTIDFTQVDFKQHIRAMVFFDGIKFKVEDKS